MLTFDFFAGIFAGSFVMYLWTKAAAIAKRQRMKAFDISDPMNQLRFIETSSLNATKPINKEAFAVYRSIEDYISSNQRTYRLLAEVGMGAFIKTDFNAVPKAQDKRAFSSYNSKRVDFLVIDAYGKPILVIEYHGSGHYQNNALARDEVKTAALRKAGINLMTVNYGTPDNIIKQDLAQYF
ncbi:hypothetical protein PsAD2_04008 [Pseudovibrio axinellae]|uniref:DUF2726 domain-containing protein n=1 Tax=Pseudovibrio axinellae TaxID=989403 RepID=A0A165U343_9HYPH|nr:DUF2726 domain-containing protein [Pseudovibrio axinellae]KZL10349.1 hypothetical protein PsAD2_04008 [Pseudovibrio axinellae]SER81408.1 Protein of unknown function [Pseudovibrio axinellae]